MKRHLVLESETDGTKKIKMKQHYLLLDSEKKVGGGILHLSVIVNFDHFVYAIQKESGNGCRVYTTISDIPIDVVDTYDEIIGMIKQEEM